MHQWKDRFLAFLALTVAPHFTHTAPRIRDSGFQKDGPTACFVDLFYWVTGGFCGSTTCSVPRVLPGERSCLVGSILVDC